MKKTGKVLIGLLLGACLLSHGAEKGNGKSKNKENGFTSLGLFGKAKNFVLPKGQQRWSNFIEQKWYFSAPDRGNFTFFTNVKNIGVGKDNALKFTMTGKKATLGWGNYNNTQEKSKHFRIWSCVYIKILARQKNCNESQWQVRPYWKGRYQFFKNEKIRKAHHI